MINFNYTIWILLIPFLMFILLGLAGHKLKPKISGLLGTSGLAVITVLSYITAWLYFFSGEKTGDTFQKITPSILPGFSLLINCILTWECCSIPYRL